MSAITAKASRKMKKYAVLTREPRCFLGSFDFSWEQRKAIDIADYSKGNGYSKGDLTDAGTPIILYGRLYTKYQFAISEVDTFAVPRNGAVYSQGNEVIVPASGETAEDIARASAVEKSGVLLGGDLNILRPFDFINPLFLALAISNGEPQKELAKKAQGKSVVHIHNTDIQEVTIAYPSRTEQDRIVSVFRQLDHLITLHQRKCVFLFGFFQAFISMIFTASTFSWEQRKLGEMGQTYTGLSGKTKDDFGHGQARFVTYMNVFSNPISNPEMTEPIEIDPKQNEVEVGDVFFTTSSETPEEVGMSSILLEKRGKTYLNSFCFGFRPSEKLDSYYLAYMLRSESTRAKIILLAQGISRYNISKNKVMEIAVSLPSLDEQKMIGQYFSQLDNLITLHQRECISFTARAGRLILTANKKRNTSSWEQRKVGDLLIERNQQAPMSDEYPLMAFIASEGVAPKGERYDRSALVTDTVNKLYKKTEKGDFIYSSNNLETGSIGLNKYGKACISPVYSIFEPTGIADSDFLGRRLVRKDFINAMVKWRQGVIYGQWRIHESDFLKIEITVPSVEEQRKIGAYLDQLDNLITLHQRKPFLMKWRTSDANRNQTNRLVL